MADLPGLSIGFDLVETNAQIEKKIMDAIYEDFNKLIGGTTASLTTQVQLVVRLSFYEQREYQSMASQGKLAKALGTPDGGASMEYVVNKIVDGIKVKVKGGTRSGSTISSNIEIVSTVDPEQLIQDPEAMVVTKKGQELPWLEWLLKEGTQQFITGYKIYWAPIPQPRSRAGGAIMVADEESNWGVPVEFAGTPNDNFITRALGAAKQKVDEIVQAEMKKVFQ